MRFGRKTKAPEAGRQTGPGCAGVALDLLLRVVSALLIAAGVLMLLFSVLDFSPGHRLRSVVVLILVPVAVFGLLWVGRAIVRDLREDTRGK